MIKGRLKTFQAALVIGEGIISMLLTASRVFHRNHRCS